jgi:hypothetical protein
MTEIQVGSVGGMVLTSENQITCQQTCDSVTLSTRKPAWTAVGLDVDLCSENVATNCLGMAWHGPVP